MATTTLAAAAVGGSTVRELNCRWLLALYALIPLSLLIVIVDKFWLDGWFINQVPINPEHWPLWTLIFGLPHIIASLLTMVDRDYLTYYRKVLLWPLLLFAGISIAGHYGPITWSYQALFIFMAFYTVYHVLAQQLGLTLMMMGVPPSRTYKAWKWCSIVVAFQIYAMVYEPTVLSDINLGPVNLREVLAFATPLLTAAVVVLGLQLSRVSRSKIGTWYLWGNVALVVSTFLFFQSHYLFFVVLVPRVIHDVSAYMVYISHDSNRNRGQARNYLYRLVGFGRLPAILLLPAASVAIAYVMTTSQYMRWVSTAIFTVTFLHYYFEGFIWRGANPHRASVNFKR